MSLHIPLLIELSVTYQYCSTEKKMKMHHNLLTFFAHAIARVIDFTDNASNIIINSDICVRGLTGFNLFCEILGYFHILHTFALRSKLHLYAKLTSAIEKK